MPDKFSMSLELSHANNLLLSIKTTNFVRFDLWIQGYVSFYVNGHFLYLYYLFLTAKQSYLNSVQLSINSCAL